jgi:hypothetical protein
MQIDLEPVALPSEEPESTAHKRPRGVTFLTLFVLSFSAWNCYRLVQAIHLREIFLAYAARGGYLYPAVSGGFWLIVGLIVAWGLWRGASWGQKAAASAAAAYGVWYWCDRLIVQIPRPDWKFALGVTVVLMAAFYVDLFDPQVLEYIKKRTQRSP